MQPEIKCLMVTQPGRLEMFRRSVTDFVHQTYQNRRLTIVTKYPNFEMQDYIDFAAVQPARITWHFVDNVAATLGSLRNKTITVGGPSPVYCLWDDDDRHHPTRLERQYQALEQHNAVASYPAMQFYWFPTNERLYLVNWGQTPVPGLLMFRETPHRYEPHLRRAEGDGFLRELQRDGLVVGVYDRPELYLRVCHAATAMPLGHHQFAARARSGRSGEVIAQRGVIEKWAAFYRLPGRIFVYGKEGRVLTISRM